MREDTFLSTIEPYWIDPDAWWRDTPVDNIEALAPDKKKILLIIGDSRHVMDDLIRFVKFGVDFNTMCMNYSPKLVGKIMPIDHYIAGDSHTKSMQKVAETLGPPTLRHCWNQNSTNFDIRWSRNSSKPWNGTTANLGVKIGIALGYLKIVLAGCPMDNSGNWYSDDMPETDAKKYKNHTAHLWKWTEIASRPIGRFIRSMSGNTADLLGEPDFDWLTDV
jgi:hypothetical protein